jgi:hypothetical protein
MGSTTIVAVPNTQGVSLPVFQAEEFVLEMLDDDETWHGEDQLNQQERIWASEHATAWNCLDESGKRKTLPKFVKKVIFDTEREMMFIILNLHIGP